MDDYSINLPTLSDVSKLILGVRDISEPSILTDAVSRIVRIVGGEVFVFHTCLRKRGDTASYRYLVGCAPSFCQEYNARKWREIDPISIYALHHARPVLSSDLGPLSRAQKDLVRMAKEAGFVASIGIPVSHVRNTINGVLYVGSTAPETEATFYANQGVFIHLANELLEWVASYVRKQDVGEIVLDSLDQHILRYSYQGFTADQIACLCEVPVSRVRSRMRRQNGNFKMDNHKETVLRAIEMGLLRLHECMDDNTPSRLGIS